jgi:hypothetical protein
VKSIWEDVIVFLCKFTTTISLYVLVTPGSGGQAVWIAYFFDQSSLGTYFTFKVLIYISFYEIQSISSFKSFLSVQYGIVYC